MAFVSDQATTGEVFVAESNGEVGDYIDLLKPRVMSLVVFTALVGLVMAPGELHPVLAVIAVSCIAVGAGASGALNMWYDADIDARMGRTAERPIPSGKVPRGHALVFGMILSAGSVLVLGVAVSWPAALFLAFTIFFYAVIYTMWLKRRTPQNIVIGGAAGAFPPMIGWMAVTGGVSVESMVLFAIIFLWTPPHFWALAILKRDDYAGAGVPMLPVVRGDDATRAQIVVYSALTAAAGCLPYVLGFAGIGYAVLAVLSGVGFVALAWCVRVAVAADVAPRACRNLFAYSILYLLLLFAALLAEHGLGVPMGPRL